jgi:hypothetical protein
MFNQAQVEPVTAKGTGDTIRVGWRAREIVAKKKLILPKGSTIGEAVYKYLSTMIL